MTNFKLSTSLNKKTRIVSVKLSPVKNKIYFIALSKLKVQKNLSLHIRFLEVARVSERLLKNGLIR